MTWKVVCARDPKHRVLVNRLTYTEEEGIDLSEAFCYGCRDPAGVPHPEQVKKHPEMVRYRKVPDDIAKDSLVFPLQAPSGLYVQEYVGDDFNINWSGPNGTRVFVGRRL
jgi:hypothetical protein